MKDRQKEYINKDRIICQEDCDFSEYDYNTLVAKCSCKAKGCPESYSEMNINKNKLLKNFKNIKNFINFNFLICYKKLFNKNSYKNNIGCYLILIFILFHIITIFVFILKQFSLLINKIKKIISLKDYEKDKLSEISKKHWLKTKKNSVRQKTIRKNVKKKRLSNKSTLNDSKTKINSKVIENFQDKKKILKII